MNNLNRLATISAPLLLASACLIPCSCKEKGEVQHFRTPKAPQSAQTAAKNPHTTPPSGATTTSARKAPYTWTLPDGWTAQPASGMRLATIIIPSASGTINASITEFGGDLAGNVNRWRGQIGLPPLQDTAVISTLKEVKTGLGKGYTVALTNPDNPDSALLAAIIPRPGGTSVFVKAPCKSTDLEKITAAFTTFTESISPSAH